MDENKFASLDNLELFLDYLKNMFARTSHSHNVIDITNLNTQDIVDDVLAQLPSAENESF